MASVTTDKKGNRRIQFVGPDGDRKSIWLGKWELRSAERIQRHVEVLLASKMSGQPLLRETAAWLTDIGRTLRRKLERVGLLQSTEPTKAFTLGEHLDDYFKRREGSKPSTLDLWGHTKRNLLTFFSRDRALTSITPGEARDFERWLKSSKARLHRYADRSADEGLAPTTVRKRIGFAKQFFQDAVDHRRIEHNPFEKLVGTAGSNRQRDHFIDRPTAAKILEACPDNEWRLIFALARFGGLRCPSETLALTWGDVDWEKSRIRVRSPKTEHHEGKDSRLLPIFPELRPHLEAAWDEAEDGQVFVIKRYRSTDKGTNTNLRTQFGRILGKAGVAPWPKLFQNLRATRATELAGKHPAHVVAAWLECEMNLAASDPGRAAAALLGHSAQIAKKHYWQVTDTDYELAIAPDQKLAQNSAQQLHDKGSNEPHLAGEGASGASTDDGKTSRNQVDAAPDDSLRFEPKNTPILPVEDRGLEPLASTMPLSRSTN